MAPTSEDNEEQEAATQADEPGAAGGNEQEWKKSIWNSFNETSFSACTYFRRRAGCTWVGNKKQKRLHAVESLINTVGRGPGE